MFKKIRINNGKDKTWGMMCKFKMNHFFDC
jgi:hypothetical protein